MFCFFSKARLYTIKNAGLFQPKFGSNMDKITKNVIKKCTVESEN